MGSGNFHFVSGFAWGEIGAAGIRTIYCGNLWIPSWMTCSWQTCDHVSVDSEDSIVAIVGTGPWHLMNLWTELTSTVLNVLKCSAHSFVLTSNFSPSHGDNLLCSTGYESIDGLPFDLHLCACVARFLNAPAQTPSMALLSALCVPETSSPSYITWQPAGVKVAFYHLCDWNSSHYQDN